jgi:hypothetical protein
MHNIIAKEPIEFGNSILKGVAFFVTPPALLGSAAVAPDASLIIPSPFILGATSLAAWSSPLQ